MKRTLPFCSVAAALCVTAVSLPSTPASAQGFGPQVGVYDDLDIPVPPRPVPGFRPGATETVVTTTRRIVAAPPAYDVAPAQTVVTTRRVVRPARVIEAVEDDFVTGTVARPLPPVPVRRVLKSEPVASGPVLVGERIVTARPVAPAPRPVVVEERRVETTRRVIRPAETEWLD